MNICDIPVSEVIARLDQSIRDRESCIYIANNDKPYAFIPDSFADNILLESNGVTGYRMHYDAEHGGGVVIAGENDLAFLVVRKFNGDSLSSYLLGNMATLLSSRFSNVAVDGNDILIGGNKVIGSAGNIINDMAIFMFIATFEDHTDLISRICPPRHGKTPSYISNSILTKQELKEHLIEWLQ